MQYMYIYYTLYSVHSIRPSDSGCAQLFTIECSMNFYCYNKSHPSDSVCIVPCVCVQHGSFPWFACFIQDNQCMFIHTYTTAIVLYYTNRCSFWYFVLNTHCQFYRIFFFSCSRLLLVVFWHNHITIYNYWAKHVACAWMYAMYTIA